MKNSIFTTTYAKDYEWRFERALKENHLDTAEAELHNIPVASTIFDEVRRITILAQGYRALAQARKIILIDALADYRQLGTINQIKVDQHILSEYRLLGTLESLKEKLSKLSEFEETANKTR